MFCGLDVFVFFHQKTAYDMRISDWSSDVCSSDLAPGSFPKAWIHGSSSCMDNKDPPVQVHWYNPHTAILRQNKAYSYEAPFAPLYFGNERILLLDEGFVQLRNDWDLRGVVDQCIRSEEHTPELQSLMRNSYA